MDLRSHDRMQPQLAGPAGPGDLDLQVPPGPRPTARPTQSLRSRKPIALAFGLAAFALVMWFATTPSRSETVERLSPDQRAALFHRTQENVRQLCAGPARPRDFCREQATLLLAFPECGPACVAGARQELLADTAVK